MAKTIKLKATLEVTNGKFTAKSTKEISVTQHNAGSWQRTQIIGASVAEELDLSGVSLARALYIENLDDNLHGDFGPVHLGNLIQFGQIGPGEVAMIPLYPGVDIAAITASGTGTDEALIQYMVAEH